MKGATLPASDETAHVTAVCEFVEEPLGVSSTVKIHSPDARSVAFWQTTLTLRLLTWPALVTGIWTSAARGVKSGSKALQSSSRILPGPMKSVTEESSADIVVDEHRSTPDPNGISVTPAPAAPVAPEGPLGPEGPVEPEGPAGPVDPVGPEGPAGPEGPLGPLGPVGPTIFFALARVGKPAATMSARAAKATERTIETRGPPSNAFGFNLLPPLFVGSAELQRNIGQSNPYDKLKIGLNTGSGDWNQISRRIWGLILSSAFSAMLGGPCPVYLKLRK